jgi:acyl carrier protein
LFGIVSDAVAKQMDDVKKEDVKLEAHLVNDFEADSVDVVAMLLALEGNFKEDLTKTNTKVPMEKLGKVHTVKDLFDLMYDVVAEVESKK